MREISRQEAKLQKERTAPLTDMTGSLLPSNLLQYIAQEATISQQALSSLGVGLSQLNLGSRLYQNLYGPRQSFSPHSEQQQEEEEASQRLEYDAQDQQDNPLDDDTTPTLMMGIACVQYLLE